MYNDNGIDKETGKPYQDLTDEEFIDCFGIMKCSQCSRHQKCKRLEQIELAKPWFSSSSAEIYPIFSLISAKSA